VEKHLAAESFAFSQGLHDPGYTLLGLQLAPGQDMDKARDAMLSTIESLALEPVTQEELERARLKYLKRWELNFTNPEQVGVALSASIAEGDWRLFFLTRDRVRQISLSEVNRVAASYLLRDNRTLGSYIPTEKPQRAPAPARVDAAPQVKGYKGEAVAAATEVFDATPANIEQRTRSQALANGMKISLLTKGARGQVVSGTVTLHLGDEKSLFGLEDVGSATGAMLNKGTATMTRQQIQDRFDQLSAQVGFHGGATSVGASIKTTRENLPAVVALVGEVLRKASFPADALEEYKRQTLAAIDEQRTDPEAIVDNEMQRYGNPYPKGDVRYAASFDEMVEATKALTVEQLRAFHQKFYGAQSAQAALVGDFDEAKAVPALAAALGDWASEAPFTRVPNPMVLVQPKRLVFKAADKQNAFMQVEQALAVSDNDADYVPLLVGNYMLGQGGSSRLWVRIREKGGLSYDVRSVITWNNHEPHSGWKATAIFAPQNRDKVETAFREEVARALKDGFGAKELAEAKESLLNFRRLSRAQDNNLAGTLASNLYLKRNFLLAQKVDEQIAAVTPEQVNAALRQYLKPAQFVYAFGGDFKD
jgi:zinc protease